jgi:hypothetical protein
MTSDVVLTNVFQLFKFLKNGWFQLFKLFQNQRAVAPAYFKTL